MTWSMLLPLVPLGAVAAAAVGWVGWVYWGLLMPARTSLDAAESVYQLARQDKAKADTALRVQGHARSAQSELLKIWDTLLAQSDFSGLALAVSDLGRMEGVTIPGMNYMLKPEKSRAVAVEASLTFQAIGTYEGIYRFIHKLEHHPMYMVIDKLSVQQLPRSKETGQPLVSFRLTLTTFLRPSSLSGGA